MVRCCPLSVCGIRVCGLIPILDYCVLPCIVSQIAGKLRLGKKSANWWLIALCLSSSSVIYLSSLLVISIFLVLGFLATGDSDFDELIYISSSIFDPQITAIALIAVVPMVAVVFLLRGKLRKIRNIEGSQCNDCCLSVICTQGVVGQMWWEINDKFMRNTYASI